MNFKALKLAKGILLALGWGLSLSAWADFKNDLPNSYPAEPVPEKPSVEKVHPEKHAAPKKSEKRSTPTPLPASSQKSSPAEKDSGLFGDGVMQHDTAAPVYFQGKSGDGSRKLGVLNLTGDVLIRQSNTTLTSDKAHLFGTAGSVPGSGTNSIQKAIAVGNVHILKKVSDKVPEMRAVGERVEFDVKARILVLKGNAKVWRADEYVNADSIQLNLDTGEMKLLDPKGTMNPKSADNHTASPKSSKN